jgi:uncharacterized protein YbjQ (UPF0145 family)
MLVTTTPNVEGKKIVKYLGIVTGETIMGANFLKDFSAGLADFLVVEQAHTKRNL